MNNEEKQIEEIKQLARDIYERGTALDGIDFVHAAVNGADDDPESHFMRIARHLYVTKGYRKASEVAREIFAEIEELLNVQTKIACETRDKHKETFEPNLSFLAMLDGRIYSLRVVEEHITELKKKYEGGT